MKPTTQSIRITKTEAEGEGEWERVADDVGQMAIHPLTHIDTISRCECTRGTIVSPKFDRVIRQ